MAKLKKSLMGTGFIESQPKNTRQGQGKHTKYAASSRNNAKKRYRGQGRCVTPTTPSEASFFMSMCLWVL